ncbi:MAG: hypothetical protein EBY28_26490, partial [Betaproteobacteria bacterium]|nr:hypothetical protein [Betaproteobacteria bacterium]
KELIVRGGNKITPLEVERALCACPGVAAAMAVGMADPVLGQRIHALLIAKAGQALVADGIRAALAHSLEKSLENSIVANCKRCCNQAPCRRSPDGPIHGHRPPRLGTP